jgi:hypothetical protein
MLGAMVFAPFFCAPRALLSGSTVRTWGAAVLRPYTRGCAIDCGKTQRPGGVNPAPTNKWRRKAAATILWRGRGLELEG